MPPAHQQDALAEFGTRLEAARVPAMLVGATAGLFYGLNRIKTDFILLGDSPFERTAFERRIADTWHGIPLWVTTGEDLVVSKLRWAKLGGSERQLADVRAILAAGHVTDFAYITRWVDALDLHEQLDASRSTRYGA